MNTIRLALSLSIAVGLVSTACTQGTIDGDGHPATSQERQLVRDEAAGVSVVVPASFRATHDAVLFKDSYGVFISGEDRDPAHEGPHDREPVARIAWRYSARPDQLETLVKAQLSDAPDAERLDVTVGEGLRGVAVIGLAGTDPYSVVYVVAGGRLYEIGLWTRERGLDARAREILDAVRFSEPTRSLESLGLEREEDSLQWQPSGEIAARNAAALAKRLVETEGDDEPAPPAETPPEAPASDLGERASALSCGILAPYGTQMQWQTQWDASANFYGYRGWTRMSGNGGSWWGEGFHVSCSNPYYHNQQYANDWPLQFGANVYSHFSGYVKYAGWARGGHYTLGRIVIVRSGKWSSLSAHLNGFGPGIRAGVWVNAPKTVIGYAGNSDGGAGYGWAPHLHSRVTFGETYNGYGMPIGGSAVMPRAFRCYGCTDFDERTSDGRKWYTKLYKNRWMKY